MHGELLLGRKYSAVQRACRYGFFFFRFDESQCNVRVPVFACTIAYDQVALGSIAAGTFSG